LKQTYKLSNTDFWKYLQIRHCLHASIKNGPSPSTDVQLLLAANNHKKGMGSAFYAYIRGPNAPNLNGLKVAWERDLGGAIKEETWKQVVSKWHTNLRETQSQLINYKILNRCYWTPSRLARIKLRDTAICWRCNKETGTIVHMLYEYDMVEEMWEKIVQFVKNIFCLSLYKNPALCMLGTIPEDVRMSRQQDAELF